MSMFYTDTDKDFEMAYNEKQIEILKKKYDILRKAFYNFKKRCRVLLDNNGEDRAYKKLCIEYHNIISDLNNFDERFKNELNDS